MSPEPIAIIGSGCRFPGEASTPSKLWELLSKPRDVLRKIDRYNYKAFYHPVGAHHGTTNVQDSYLLTEDHRLFDAQFFNIKPVEADAIDPMQRILLETVYESLENAGVTIESLQGSDTAFYVGVMAVEYLEHLLRDLNALPTYFATGTSRAIVSNRISYFFDWHGPSMTIDTACSSSMIALHQAVQTLRSGESRVAVAAGADLILGPEIFIGESKLNMLSPTGRSRMWDAGANGYARGEGFASVVLKRLSDAIADGDHIECIVRETGTNQDGRTKGITMPNPLAQVSMIRNVYARAGLDLNKKDDRPQLFEAHGTGTPAGDPLEAEAICKSFFGEDLQFEEKEVLHVGSIKTIIGHTEGTAGLAGVLKASLAIQNKLIPPNLLFERLNPAIAPFYNNLLIPTSATPWPELPAGVPRRASVNSFGFGGSNAHAILESYDPFQEIEEIRPEAFVFTPFTFSATSEKSLAANMATFSSYLKANKTTNLRDLAWTLQTRRSAFPIKATISALSVDDLISKLDAKFADSNKAIGIRSSLGSRKILGIFTGQGAQWPKMGKELIVASSYVRNLVADLEKSLSELPDGPDWKITEELMAEGKESRLGEAALSQPLCTAVQIVLVDLLRSAGVKFSSVVGHSSGEIGAAYAAGFLSAADAIKIAYYRGLHAKLAANSDGMKGAMLAAGTSLEDAKELCDLPYFRGRISVAASNSSSSVTLSGDIDRIQQAKLVFDDEKKFARLLKVDTAYHSHHMIPPSAPYVDSLEQMAITIQQPDTECVWYSSVYGGTKMGVTNDLKCLYWRDNMVSTVLFSQAVEAAMNEGPFGAVLEVGPHPALKGPASSTMQETSGAETAYSGVLSRNMNDVVAFSESLGFLWSHLGSSSVNFTTFDHCISSGAKSKALIDLPPYCWEHDRVYYCESRVARAYNERADPPHELLGVVDEYSTEKEIRWRNLLIPKEMPWMDGHQIQGQIVFPAAGYISMAVEAAKIFVKDKSVRLIEIQDLDIGRAITFDNESTGVETLCTFTTTTAEENGKGVVTADFMVYSCLNKHKGSLQLMASCRVEVDLGEPSPDTLPSLGKPLPNMADIDIDRFYSNLTQIGFGYKGPFRQMSSLNRKLGFARGLIHRSANDGPVSKLLVHPPTVDIAFHGVMATWFFPMDDRLWTILLPRSVKRITVNPALCNWNTDQALSQPWNSTLTHENPGEIFGDVDIYDDQNRAFMQVEGLKLVALKGTTKADDRNFYYEEVWSRASLDTSSIIGLGPASPRELDLTVACERVAYFYSKSMDKEMPIQDWKRFGPQYARLAKSMANTLSLARSGKHTSFKKEWSNDTRDDISALVDTYSDIPDLKLMCIVGDHLAATIQSQGTILELMDKDKMLSKYYESGLGFSRYHQYLAQMAKQIAHRYPQMSVLEIGAQEGKLTRHVLKALGEAFASYTYTNKSTVSIESAQPLFKEHNSKMTFKTLDIENNPSAQGFSSNSYDLIVASLAFQTSRDLETTLRNVRSLLTPGGYLLFTDITSIEATRFNFTFGALPDGMYSCIPAYKWNSILRRAGFSGVDTITADKEVLAFPFSLIASQAVDDRISYLRRPLFSLGSQFNLEDLLILGGSSLETWNFVEDFAGLMSRSCSQITTIDSIDDIGEEGLPPVSAIVSVADLDDPIFQNLTPSRWESMKRFFDQARNVLWITRGRKADNPYSAMSVGFWRSVAYELPHVKIQFLDIAPEEKLSVYTIAELLLQFCALATWERDDTLNDLMWTLEPELSLENEKLSIPRVIQQPEMNDRLNSSRRLIMKDASAENSTLEVETHGSFYQVTEASSSTLSSNLTPVKVTHSSLSAIRIGASANLFISVGSNIKTGERVLAFSESNASIIYCREDWVIPCDIPFGTEPQFLLSIASELLAQTIFTLVPKQAVLVIREPTPVIASILDRQASEKSIRIVSLTSHLNQRAPEWVYVHSRASNSEIKKAVHVNPACFVDFVGGDSLGSRISTLLPPTCKQETISDLLGKESRLRSSSPSAEITELAKLALSHVFSGTQATTAHAISLADVVNETISKDPHSIIDWTLPETVPVVVKVINAKTLFSKEKSYFLVGLTGDVGRSICMWMAKNGAGTIIMTSRRPNVDPDWIEAVEDTGCVVKVFAMDVIDKDSVQSVYETCQKTLPPIAGVANAAMLMRDQFFLDMSLEHMEDVLKPKVDGTNNLNELFADTPLDFFILFSSLACVIGNDGQSNYSAANMYMTTIAHQRKSRGLAGSVMDIGRVVGVGYLERANQSVDARLAKHGMMAVSETDLHHIFAEAILAGRPDSPRNPELITGLAINKDKDAPVITWHSNPRFSHLAVQEKGQATKNDGKKANVAVKLQLQGATTKAEALDILQTCFAMKMQTILQLPVDGVDKAVPLVELGVDSLVAVEVRSWFLKELSTDIPVLKVLGGASVADLCILAMEKLPETLFPNLGATKASPTSAKPVPAKSPVNQPKPLKVSTPPASTTSASTTSASNSPPSSPTSQAKGSGDSNSSTSVSDAEDVEHSKLQLSLERTEKLSSSQSRFWFLKLYVEDQTTFNVTFYHKLTGSLRIPDLERAVTAVGQKHEALRTCFVSSSQGVMETSKLHLERKSISSDEEAVSEFEEMKKYVYDIEKGDTMRVLLLTKSSTSHFIIFGHHHIIMDGVSFQIFLADLETAYNRKPLLSKVHQYPDYAATQQDAIKNGGMDKQLAFWQGQYPEVPAVLPLFPMTTTTRRPMKHYSLNTAMTRLSTDLAAKIHSKGVENKTTNFHFYLATLKIMLFRFLDTEDLVIGIADANRNASETLGSIGLFLNMLPLRFKSNPNEIFSQAVQEARNTAFAALSNSQVPFDLLLDKLNVPRSASYNPLFQAFFDYRQGAKENPTFANCKLQVQGIEPGKSAYDISLDITESSAGPLIILKTQDYLYSQSNTELLLKSYVNLLEGFAGSDTSVSVEKPSLFQEDDINQALKIGQGTLMESDWPETLPHRIDSIAQQHQNTIAVKDGFGIALTYQQLTARADVISSALLAAGVTIGSKVAVFQEPTSDWICSMLAIMRIGAIYVPLDLKNPLPRLAANVKNCRPTAILAHGETIESAPALEFPDAKVLNISELPVSSQETVENLAKPDSTAAILFTSGSTGVPKGILLSHLGLRNVIEGYFKTYNIGSENVLQQSAFSFDMSLHQIFISLCNGGTLYIAPKSIRGDPREITKLIKNENITYTKATPSEYSCWIRYGRSDLVSCSQWKTAFGGGEVLTDDVLESFRSLHNPQLRLFNAYGPAETSLTCTLTEVHYNKPIVGPTSLGHPMPNTSLYIVDENLNPLPVGMSGEVVVGGAGLAFGYLGEEKMTEEKFIQNCFAPESFVSHGWNNMYRSGDKGQLQKDGSLIFQGRIGDDTQIKLRGLRIELKDIESTLVRESNGALISAVVSARGDPQFLVAHVVFSQVEEENRAQFLQTLLSNLPLPQYMIPVMAIPLENLPLNNHGKIDRLSIKNLPLPTRSEEPLVELTGLELRLNQVWEDVLSKEITSFYAFNRSTSFFAVGGNSMFLVELQSRIRSVFDVTLTLQDMFDNNTLGEMASKIETSVSVRVIDWEEELSVTGDVRSALGQVAKTPISDDSKVVLLTGATGFLGKRILNLLVADDKISKIHCVATRPQNELSAAERLPVSDKITVHTGDFTAPLLGLSDTEFQTLSASADAIIHCGAKRAFWDNYHQLRKINVSSTQELVKLSAPRQIPIHFISSGGVLHLASETNLDLEEASVSRFPPPVDGSDGYVATKWASERYLENAVRELDVPVQIYRFIPGAEANNTLLSEVRNEFLVVAKELHILPSRDGMDGDFDLIPADVVAREIVDGVVNQKSGSGLGFKAFKSEIKLKVEDSFSWVDDLRAEGWETMPTLKWLGRIKKLGFGYLFASHDLTISRDDGNALVSKR